MKNAMVTYINRKIFEECKVNLTKWQKVIKIKM